MHIVTDSDYKKIKHKVREVLLDYGIAHTTIELEDKDEKCDSEKCEIIKVNKSHDHH